MKKPKIFISIPKKKKMPKTRQIASKAYVDKKLDQAIQDKYKDTILNTVGDRTPTSIDLLENITQGDANSSQRNGDALKIKNISCKFKIEQGALQCTCRVIIFQWRIFNDPLPLANVLQYPNTENVTESPYNFNESQPNKLYNILYDKRFTYHSPITTTGGPPSTAGDVVIKLGSMFKNKNFVKHINFTPGDTQILKNNLYLWFMSDVSTANPGLDKPVLQGWVRVTYEDA